MKKEAEGRPKLRQKIPESDRVSVTSACIFLLTRLVIIYLLEEREEER